MTLGKGFYRFLGIVAAIVSIVQSVIWIILSLCGIICYYADCGALPRTTAFGRAFNLVYLSNEGTVNSPCIDPIFFHVIMWLYLFISIIWVVTSGYLLFCTWKNSKKHQYSGPVWIMLTLLVCLFDFAIFVVFAVDFHRSLDTSNFNMTVSPSAMERSNFDCVFRRMYDFENPKGEYTPEEREMIKLSLANEKARLTRKMQQLEKLTRTLNEYFIANKRNPLLLPPKFTTPAAEGGLVPNSVALDNIDDDDELDRDDFDSGAREEHVNEADDDDDDELDRDDFDFPTSNFEDHTVHDNLARYHGSNIEEHTMHHNIARRLAICNERFRHFRTRIGARMMVAPAATMMTLALRGYVLWVFNICLAVAMWHFYVYKQRESFLRRISI